MRMQITTMNQECRIQIPSLKDLMHMYGMPAGGSEDQYTRLKHMVQVVQDTQLSDSSLLVMNTDEVSLPPHWNQLFAAMNTGQIEVALKLFTKMPQNDELLQVLLAVHSQDYLQRIIIDCIQAQQKGWKQLNSDI